MLLPNNAALVAHSEEQMKHLMNKEFSLIISLKKINKLGQGVKHHTTVTINNFELEAVYKFAYLSSTITNNLSLHLEMNR